MTDKGHWEFPYDFDINEWFGFIYRITEIKTGKEYIGKRQFHQHLRKPVKGKVNKKKVIKESNWKMYTSSSKQINEIIKNSSKDEFKFEILSLHKTRASLVYAEVHRQITEDVLRARLPDGTRKFYNGHISAIKFIPPEEHPDEKRMKMSHILKERNENSENCWLGVMSETDQVAWKQKYFLSNNI